jgi:hypothetical protein
LNNEAARYRLSSEPIGKLTAPRKIPIKGFQDYVNLFLGDKDPSQRIYEKARPAASPRRSKPQQATFLGSLPLPALLLAARNR